MCRVCFCLYFRLKKKAMENEFGYERICRCALNLALGYKPAIAAALIDHLGSAADVMKLDREELEDILGPFSVEDRLTDRDGLLEKAEKELREAARYGAVFLHAGDTAYPALLRECEDAPIGFYCRSCSAPEEVFAQRPFISIVGTRDISLYGREWCERLVSSLSSVSPAPCVVSGLALGTDICAHLRALDLGLPTIAVMATGIDSIYPAQHRNIAMRIASTPGCALISDYPCGTAPLKNNFIRRNRIIAGLSSATLLIESKIKGGGMMTARLAFSYDREVYALPGRIDDLRSQGCNYLIKGNMAEAVTDCGSFLDSLGLTRGREGFRECRERRMEAVLDGKLAGSSEDVATILLLVKRNRGIDLDELVRRSGLEYKRVSALVTALEEEGIIGIDLLRRCRIL